MRASNGNYTEKKGNAELGAGAAHSEALNFIANELLSEELKASIGAIGHRIVHGVRNSLHLLLLTTM